MEVIQRRAFLRVDNAIDRPEFYCLMLWNSFYNHFEQENNFIITLGTPRIGETEHA